MTLDIDYPASDADAAALSAWCSLLLDELNRAFGRISDTNVLGEDEKLVNWK